MKNIVLRSAIVAALGGLLFGFDTAVISGTTQALRQKFELSELALGFTVASALVGTIIGALATGRPADRYGRKNVLFVIGILYLVSAVGSAVVDNWYLFILFRFIGGLGIGGASVTAPIYTAEIAPPRLRGRLVGLVQFNVVLGILLAYLSNYFIDKAMEESIAWRWMLGIEALPAAIFILLLVAVPESPRWLFLNGQKDQARANIKLLAASEQEAQELENEIQEVLDQAQNQTQKTPFFVAKYKKVILLAVAIAAFNQLSGINAIMYYVPDIFRLAGAGDDSAFLQSIAVGGMNLIATMVALTVIDKFGRRKLMFIGSLGYLVSLGLIVVLFTAQGENFGPATSTMLLVSLLLFIAAHAFGQGAVIWVFISEIFPSQVRARGQALGSFTHWAGAFVVTWAFPPIINGVGPAAAFALFFVCMVAQLVWVLKVMPETKGVPLEEMERKLVV